MIIYPESAKVWPHGDVYAKFRGELAAMTDADLLRKAQEMYDGHRDCPGIHDRTNPRYALFFDGYEMCCAEQERRIAK